MPDPTPPPDPTKSNRTPPDHPPHSPVNWRVVLWYLPTMLILLWLWQDAFYQMTIRTIDYSQFKAYLAKGEVVQCDIKDDEIVGRIRLKPAPDASHEETAAGQKPPAAAHKSSASSPASAASPESPPANPPPSHHPAAPDAAPAAVTTITTIASAKGDDTAKHAAPAVPAETKQEGTANKPSAAAAADVAKPATAGPEEFVFRTVRVEDPGLVAELEAQHVEFKGVRPGFLSTLLVSWIIPLGLMVLLWMFLTRRLGASGQTVMNIGKSRGRLVGEKQTGVTFNDVAGCDEAKYELQEVVDFMQNPRRYASLGAKIPKGVLLVGPPGTGKTLLAKAVAGEAEVPFFSLSGSDFVEMFVGVGASRVRDMFQQAKAQAPCIVFIDELDAIGRERGVHVGSVNDEREQTLNQLLVEMDGFEPNLGVILLAATNRPEVLDRALLRPGRFDRQVIVDAPDLRGRQAILAVHARGKPLADDVDLRGIAQGTPGFSGADLANALNEAALLAARRKSTIIMQRDLEEAIEKVVAGPERRSRRLGDAERERVAYHEVGHALVGTYSEHADPVHKISIVPRGRAALGYTLQLPVDEQFLMTRSELIDRLKGLLGGRAAEETIYHEISTGAENDLERATALARQMVCMYGMSDEIGLVHCARRDGRYVPHQNGELRTDCSPHTAELIDAQVKRLLETAYHDALQILAEHRDTLETVSAELLQHETLDAATFNRLLNPDPTPANSG